MKLQNWTFYKINNIRNFKTNEPTEMQMPFLLISADLTKPNRYLGLVIDDKIPSPLIMDLMNRPMDEKSILNIFKNNRVIVSLEDIHEYEMGGKIISNEFIRDENINIISKIFGIKEPKKVKFDSEEFSSVEKFKDKENFFSEPITVKEMPTRDLVNLIEQTTEIHKDLLKQKMDGKNDSIFNEKMFIVQNNLIVYLRELTHRMDQDLIKQFEIIKELKHK